MGREGEGAPVEGGVVGVELDGPRVERGGLEVVPRLELLVPLVLELRRPSTASVRHRRRRRRRELQGLGFWGRELLVFFQFLSSFFFPRPRKHVSSFASLFFSFSNTYTPIHRKCALDSK